MKNLWVDDERPAPEGWDLAKSYQEAIDKLETINYDKVSLDHDIASFDENGEKTGYDIALWLANRKYTSDEYIPSKIECHSANPVGRLRIEGVVNRYLK